MEASASTTPMAQTPLTPAPSIEPKTETPGPRQTRSPAPSTHKEQEQKTRPFLRQQQNDRNYYKKYISAHISVMGKWALKTPEDRWELIKAKRKDLMKYRQSKRFGTTAADFEDMHDEEDELDWLRMTFLEAIENGGAGAVGRRATEQDDEEELPGAKPEYNDGGQYGRGYFSCTVYGRNANGPGEDATDNKKPLVVCKAVSRGFSISIDCAGFNKAKIEVDASFGDGLDFAAVKVEDGQRQAGMNEAHQNTKRTWRWVDGKMVVWPPLEGSNGSSNIDIKLNMDLR